MVDLSFGLLNNNFECDGQLSVKCNFQRHNLQGTYTTLKNKKLNYG